MTTSTELETPSCVFCGEPTHMFSVNDGGVYVCAVLCDHCGTPGPEREGTDLDDTRQRALVAYQRATKVRERLAAALRLLVSAIDQADIDAAKVAARKALRAMTAAGERRPTR